MNELRYELVMFFKAHQMMLAWDLDDTIINGSSPYKNAENKLVKLMGEVGFSQVETFREHERQYKRLSAKFPIGPELQKHTKRETYKSLVQLANRPIESYIVSECERIASGIYLEPVALIDGALQTLDWFQDHEIPMALVTRGERQSQVHKILSHNLERYFDVIEVLSDKKSGTWLRFCQQQQRQPKQMIIIGDSCYAEVNPGLEIGAQVIHVQTGKFTLEHTKPLHEGFASVPSIRDVPEALIQLLLHNRYLRMGTPPIKDQFAA